MDCIGILPHSMSFREPAGLNEDPIDADTSTSKSKADQTSPFHLESDPEEQPVPTMRCLTDRQRQLLIAVFGTLLSALMTVCLVYLLNQIRG